VRAGHGFDAHRFGGPGPLKLGGVVVAADRGLVGTSDADVVAHAVADALLGAAALGDLGTYFPTGDPQWEGADSMALLADVVERVRAAGLRPDSLDVTVIAERVRVAPYRDAIRRSLAAALGIPLERTSVKATSTDGMGALGADEGMAALATVVLAPPA
jgi:2-C-methyl-D-erythritol 2,4-cyclodiphosphate synthase